MTPEWEDSDKEILSYKVLNAQEAKKLQAAQPELPLLKVLVIQLLAGLVVVLSSMFWWGHSGVVFCAVVGVVAAWIPSALMTGWMLLRHGKGLLPVVFLVEFYFMEFIKVILTIALLFMAFVWVRPLVWPSLLAGFVVTIKAYYVACWLLLNQYKE